MLTTSAHFLNSTQIPARIYDGDNRQPLSHHVPETAVAPLVDNKPIITFKPFQSGTFLNLVNIYSDGVFACYLLRQMLSCLIVYLILRPCFTGSLARKRGFNICPSVTNNQPPHIQIPKNWRRSLPTEFYYHILFQKLWRHLKKFFWEKMLSSLGDYKINW